jgi:hypothetical protein
VRRKKFWIAMSGILTVLAVALMRPQRLWRPASTRCCISSLVAPTGEAPMGTSSSTRPGICMARPLGARSSNWRRIQTEAGRRACCTTLGSPLLASSSTRPAISTGPAFTVVALRENASHKAVALCLSLRRTRTCAPAFHCNNHPSVRYRSLSVGQVRIPSRTRI